MANKLTEQPQEIIKPCVPWLWELILWSLLTHFFNACLELRDSVLARARAMFPRVVRQPGPTARPVLTLPHRT